jgi:hypothetical protein
MQMERRGQAALEFLMTYGWAILVVLIVIGALAYFGVLNPTILLPEKCTLETGLYCKNHKIDTTGKVLLELENGKGQDIILYSINVSGELMPQGCFAAVYNGTIHYTNASTRANCGTTSCAGCTDEAYYGCNPYEGFNSTYNDNIGLRIPQSKSVNLVLTCADGALSWNGKTKADITIEWYSADSSVDYLHTMNGELLAKVEG